jgi:ketosteroid isomerase-like protein
MNGGQKIFQLAFLILTIICAACDNKNRASDGTSTLAGDTTVILRQEQNLIKAYKSNDMKTVASLYDDHLIFNTPDGRAITKTNDIGSLQSGTLKIDEYSPSNYLIDVIDDVATVSVSIHIKGKAANNIFEGDFKFLRIWKRVGTDWKLIAISGTQVK